MEDKQFACQRYAINQEKVNTVSSQMYDDNIFIKLSETFKILSDKTRTKILYALSKEELCVCEISTILDMSVSAISHHLRPLRNMKLVKYRKEGREVYYSLNDEHIVKLLEMAYDHVKE